MKTHEMQAKIESLEMRLAELEEQRGSRPSGRFATVLASHRARLVFLATAVMIPAAAYAAVIGVPHTFSNGTIADANEVNANFSTLVTESNAQDARLTALESQVATHTSEISANTSGIDANSSYILALQSGVGTNTLDIATNQSDIATNASGVAANATSIATNATDIDAIETITAHMWVNGNTLTFTGVNVQIVNGLSQTDGINGLGNLIVGYNENNFSATRTGSHNLVVGIDHEYTSYAGLVAGMHNTISGIYASVSGGQFNEASGSYSSVSGGHWHQVSGAAASVSGGYENTASGWSSSVGGGWNNTASNSASTVSGGQDNVASGYSSSVSGGQSNKASNQFSSVSGGNDNEASAGSASVAGGDGNWAGNICSGGTNSGDQCHPDTGCPGGGTCGTNLYQSVSGGQGNEASGDSSSVSGGHGNKAGGSKSSVSGGDGRSGVGEFDWAAGALWQDN